MESNSYQHKTSEEVDLSRFYRELLLHWKYFVVAFIALMFAAFMYIRLTLPEYRAVSTVLIKDKSKVPSKSLDDILSGDLFGEQQNVATEMGVLDSRSVKQEVIKNLGLQVGYFNVSGIISKPMYKSAPFKVVYDEVSDYIFNTPFYLIISNDGLSVSIDAEVENQQSFSFSKQIAFGEKITSPYFSLTIFRDSLVNLTDDNDFKFIIYSYSKIFGILDENLNIEPLNKDASIVVMSYNDNIPQRAVDILNGIGNEYINLDIKDKASVASLTLKFVEEQLAATTAQLEVIEQELQSFKEKNKTVDLSIEAKAILDKLNAVETQRMQSQIEMESLDNLLEYVSSNKDMTQLAPSSLGIPDPLLVQLIQNYQQLQSKRNSIAYGIKSDAPAVRVIDKQIEDTRASLIENIKSIQANIRTTNQTLKDNIAVLESSISRIPETERDLIAIKRKFDVNQNIYLYLLQKKAETSIAKATVVSDNRVLDEALLLDEPVSPNKKLVFGIAFALALILPVLFIVFQTLFRTTVSNRDSVTALTSLPIIGVAGHLNEPGNMAVIHNPKSPLAEAFRSIRTNLQFYGVDKNKKVILITSSVSGEGKSFVSINLASVFALQGNKVVLVGLDLRKPKLIQDFNLDNNTGITKYLIGQVSVDEIIRSTGIENLDIVSSGPIPPNPSELISTPEMDSLFEELRQRYDLIIVDTPPLGIVSDAFILMKYSDINLYIVRENFSRLEYIRSLEEMNREGKFSNMSILINDADFNKRYGYGYGYGYGHNYGHVRGGDGYFENNTNGLPFYKRIFKRRV
ncbi:MAG: polysaccharide biosynthesis tyrosine autokinase [Bacteroidia bacterium]|nr:polysaccharide biosynthesis tyrosine autokinase [Bacteroidia bacterium]MCZ2278112.1 polysaccharide biosynthesis tyrosine autokinase [Bacteroidia bacterium]